MEELRKKHGEKLRFGLVGIVNTGLDFGLLFLFVSLGVDKIISNYFSTGFAFLFSFFANKSFTFKERPGGNTKRQFILFIIVTLVGLWILQPIVIWLSSSMLSIFITNNQALLLVAKLFATITSLCWNYIFYSRFVFRKIATEEAE